MQSDKSTTNSYHFDDITIDCENFRLLKAEEVISITPRAFDVLVYLLKNNERVVEKQELFEKIWKDAFVTDNALTKVIKEIRHAINDDASAPRYIETIPKRGYRFVKPIKNGDSAAEQSSQSAKTETKQFANLPRRQTVRKSLLAIGIVVGLIVSGIGFIVVSELHSEYVIASTPIDSIAVLPFETNSNTSEIQSVSEKLAENLINSLSHLPNIRVLPRNTAFIYKNKQEDPHILGRGLRVRSVLSGKITQQNDTLHIQVELIDVERKAQIWGEQYSCSINEVTGLQKEISRALSAYLSQ